MEVSQFSHCCGQIPLYFIQYVLCSAQFCQIPDLLQGAGEGLVRTDTSQVWALCTEPCAAKTGPTLGLPFTHQSMTTICSRILFQEYVSPYRSQIPTIIL